MIATTLPATRSRPVLVGLVALAFVALPVLAVPSALTDAPEFPEAKLVASDGAAYDSFGWSVSVSDDTAIIGSRYDDDMGENSGSAYVYARSGNTWALQAKLVPADGAAGDQFGYSVSVSGDTAIIGSTSDDDMGMHSGSAYVYVRSGTTWTLQAKLVPTDGAAWNQFGWSVSVSGDTAIIGSPWKGSSSGSAYIYMRSGDTWALQAKLVATDGAAYEYFGWSVSVSGDTAIIGSIGDDDKATNSGSASVYTRSGDTWTLQAKLLATDGAADDQFGGSVSVSGDAAIIGSTGDDDKGAYSGSAYVYARSGTVWTQQSKLVATDGAEGDQFGYSVSVSGDTALIGSPYDDDKGIGSGSAYVYTRSGTTWNQQPKLVATDGAKNDLFGYSVSVNGDTALIGSYRDDDKGTESGSAHVYIPIDQIDVLLELDNNGQVPLDAITYGGDITASTLDQLPVERAKVVVKITHEVMGEPLRIRTVTLITDENGIARLTIPLDYTLPGTYTVEIDVTWGSGTGSASGAYTRIAV